MASRLQIRLNRGMESRDSRRVELVLPLRTVLIVVATLAVMAAFVAIGDTFLVIFVGIFLALVFEFPVRFVMAKTGLSRGLAATLTVLGAALAVTLLALLFLVRIVGNVRDLLKDLPSIVEQLRESSELSFLGDTGAAENAQQGAQQRGRLGARRDLRRARAGRRRLLGLHRRVHDPLHVPLPAVGYRQHEAGPGERARARRG